MFYLFMNALLISYIQVPTMMKMQQLMLMTWQHWSIGVKKPFLIFRYYFQ